MVTMKTEEQHKSIFLVNVVTEPTNACIRLIVCFIIYIVCLLHVLATLVAILREVHCEG